MNSNTLIIFTLCIIGYGPLLGAVEPPVVEELPAANCCDPIVVYRKVYLYETLPELGARLYDKVDYELKIRTLTRDINIAEAELAVQRDRERVYDRYFSRTSALYVTRQETKLAIVKSEEQLKLLRQE
ncbi:MAG: hypothetical protein HYV60_10125, partial [Planctomycetia bacterium]|nr:hypothetical protein [Planctomycetia bacterium]